MPSIAEQIRERLAGSATLLAALDAVRNRDAAILLAATFGVFALSMVGLGGVSAWLSVKSGAVGGLLFLFSALIWAAILLIGGTAAGIVLADEVWAREPRGIPAALSAAAAAAPRLLGVILLAGAVLIAWLMVLALALLLCKLPVVGPLLYAFVLPVGTLVTGLLVFTLGYLLLPLAAPCIWNGNSAAATLATLREVLRSRLPYVVVMFLLLGLLALIVAGIVGFVIFGGTGLTVSLSLAVVGFGGSFDSSLAGLGGGAGSYGAAFGFGMTLLFLIGAMPSTLVGLKGAAIIHKEAIAGLAVDEAAADLQRQLEDVRRRAQEAKERALAPKPPPPRPSVCPNAACGAPVGPDDTFCIACGEKLR